VFADGEFVGTATDQGHVSGAWGVLVMKHAGPNTVTAQVVDTAGNRSASSRGVPVTGYFTPGCTPYHF
jgi:chitodextrinase